MKEGKDESKLKELKTERERILKEIRKTKNLMRGSMYERERKCGGKNCWCYKSEKGHPQTMLTLHSKGKQIGISIRSERKKEVRAMIEEYNRLWDLIERLTDVNIKIIREER